MKKLLSNKKLINLIFIWGEKMEKFINNYLLPYRKTCIVIFAFLGLFLFLFFSLLVACLVSFVGENNWEKFFLKFNFSESFVTSVYLIVLALPLSFYLWLLRNEDKLTQIEYQRENNHFNSFSHAVSLFTEEKDRENIKEYKVKNALGLRLLVRLKNQGVFEKEIDMITSCRKDLSGINLQRADLRGANLQGADLSGANLVVADLSGANLMGVDLSGANLQGAKLSGANLMGVDLSGADLWEANLSDANLLTAKLQRSNLSNANLQGAHLSGANLMEAHLLGATFLITTKENFIGNIFKTNFLSESNCVWSKISYETGLYSSNVTPIPVKIVRQAGKYYLEEISS